MCGQASYARLKALTAKHILVILFCTVTTYVRIAASLVRARIKYDHNELQ